MRLPLITIGLGACNVLLALAIAVQWINGSQREPLMQSANPAPPHEPWRLELPTAAPDLETIKAQAVFHKTRTFYVAPPASSIELPVPDYRFTGSMSIPNQPLTAMLVNNQTNVRAKVKVGDVLDQWTVTHVGPRHVTLSLGSRIADIGSNPGERSNGLTVLSGSESPRAQIQPASSEGAVRILSAPGGVRHSASVPSANMSGTEAARMYQPSNR